jgi:Ni,Fe-hydrogenase I cytochrome b subunit
LGDKEPATGDTETMADNHQNEHKHGTMDIREQEKTFEGFIRLSIWVVCISIGVLIFLGLANS